MAAETGRGLRISKVLARYVDGRSETSLDPDLRVFVSDLVRPYGLPLREDLLGEGVGHSYAEMAEGLLGEALADSGPVDLLILAFDTPDVRPGAPASLAMSRSCPGSPLAFAVCDQGSAAAFTALRIAADYQRTGVCRRAVVVVVEQTALHYRPAEPVELPERHCVVVLVCEEAGGGGLTVRQASEPEPASEALEKAVRAQAETLGAGLALVLGPGLAVGDDSGEAVTASAAQPFTGVWAELAGRLPGWQAEQRPVLVAGHDRRLGVLSTLALRPGP
ncbi:hypothetical protein [Kitasatospora sp. NPDC092286]|uniref:hypothetical protein n=1 Tax=Kitasatospora sp. NPDC092286 TaxID=3364087 RepID=UPI003800F06F